MNNNEKNQIINNDEEQELTPIYEDPNDTIHEEGESFAVAEDENENMVAISVVGLYADKDEKKYKRPMQLRKDPPQLEISSSNGDKVHFALTYQFAQSMGRLINDVNHGYLGFKKTRKKFNTGNDTSIKGKTQVFINVNRILFLILFIGIVFGISIARGFTIGVIVSVISVILVLLFNYSIHNNRKEEDE